MNILTKTSFVFVMRLFLLCCDFQIMLLPEGIPPPVGLQPAQAELHLPRPRWRLELPDQVDDGAVAELLLVVPAERDHLLLALLAEVHLGQDGQTVLVSLAQQTVKQDLKTETQIIDGKEL